MPSDDLVVSDTSPSLNLALIEGLSLLRSQFSSITIPAQVWQELADGDAGLDALRALRDDEFLEVVEVEESDLFTEIYHELDLGETAAICHAIQAGADLVLLDERDGREVARRHDLTVTGVVGILLRGAKNGDVELRRELDALRDAGFWISDDLYSKVLAEEDELRVIVGPKVSLRNEGALTLSGFRRAKRAGSLRAHPEGATRIVFGD